MRLGLRQAEILNLLARETGISAGDLALRFKVSRMTIHRDLQSLHRQGLLLRIHGGAVAKSFVPTLVTGKCAVCDYSVLPHQRCEIYKSDGSRDLACCAACGLRQFMCQASVERMLVGDQLTGQMLLAEEAFFLVNSLASPCCQPSLLSFAKEEDVTLFQAGFGGSISRLDEALEFLRVAEGLDGGGGWPPSPFF